MFALRHKDTKTLASWGVDSNDGGEFCNAYSVNLEYWKGGQEYPIATFQTQKEAESALKFDTEWYNASFTSPGHGYSFVSEKDNFEVVELTIK